MTHFESLVSGVSGAAGVEVIGIMRQIARIKHGIGKEASDVLGFDYVLKDKEGICLEFYAAEPPLIGMTQPTPVACPLGIVVFNGYKITYGEAIELFKKSNCGDAFTAMSLSWPLTHPASNEPFWHIRSNLGSDFVVGAISGQTECHPGITPLYMGPGLKYMGPQV
jgi:hypothetical protein